MPMSYLPITLIAAGLILFVVLLYLGRGYWAWVGAAVAAFAAWGVSDIETPSLFWTFAALIVACAVLFGVAPVRRPLLSAPLMGMRNSEMAQPSSADCARARLAQDRLRAKKIATGARRIRFIVTQLSQNQIRARLRRKAAQMPWQRGRISHKAAIDPHGLQT